MTQLCVTRVLYIQLSEHLCQNTVCLIFFILMCFFSSWMSFAFLQMTLTVLRTLQKQLIVWAFIDSASSLFKVICSKAVIVTSANDISLTHNILETEDFHFNSCQKGHQKLMKSFFSISLLYLFDDHLFWLTQHCQLRRFIVSNTDEMWEVCLCNHCLFTALHLHSFCQKAIVHAADIISQLFSFIIAT